MDHIQRDNYCGDCRDRRSDCPFHVCIYLQIYGLQPETGDSSVQKEHLPPALYPCTGHGDCEGEYGGDPPDHFQQRGGGAGDGACPHEPEIQFLQGAPCQFNYTDTGDDHGVHGRGRVCGTLPGQVPVRGDGGFRVCEDAGEAGKDW